MRIEVTSDDIEDGFPGDTGYCAIALACKRAFNAERVEFDNDRMIVINDERFNCAVYDLPIEALIFVNEFDAHSQVLPFAFDMDESEYDDDKY